MADERARDEEALPPARRPIGWAIARWAGIVLGALVLIVAAGLIWLQSESGRAFVAGQINRIETASGLTIHVDRIDGSLFSHVTLHGLRVGDPQGTFLEAPLAELDYRPLAYLRSHIDIESLIVPRARLRRLPALKPSAEPNAPLLPDIDLDIGHLRVGRLVVDPPVTGRRHLLALDARAKIADRRAQVGLNLRALAAPGIAGGDRLVMRLDAVPEANRLDIALAARGPADGFIAGLTGLNKDLALRVFGRGDWARWQGRAQAALGGEGLADLDIAARDGTFTVRGPLRPGLFLAGPVERLTGPLTRMDLTATLRQRAADLRLRLNSRALAVAVEGGVDLAHNRYQGLRVAARLLEPGAIAPNLAGRDVQLAMVLNGAFATPRVAYELSAARLAFGTTVVQGLAARGAATVDADQVMIPVAARAQRILGFDALAGGTIANVALDGTLGVTWPRLVSDNLRLRSDRIDATLALAFDFSKGRYLAAVQGRVNDYLVHGVGLFDVTTNLDLTSSGGGFGLSGRVAARSRRIDNAAAAGLLGGPTTVSANVAMDPNGVIRIDTVRLVAPQLRISQGGGTYRPNGAIDINVAGASTAYGPLAVHVTGTVAAPQFAIRAARPGFGIGLADVTANVRATPSGWAIEARGQSDYGPFTADVVILSNAGPLTIRINRLTIVGLQLQGRVVRSAAGPFVGTLTLAGQGLDGTVRLSAAGSVQRIDARVTANGAHTPGDVPILIRRGLLTATAILYPNAPQITADAQVAGLTSGDLNIGQARVRVAYRGGRGTVQALAEGSRGVPFRVAANAALTPGAIRVAAQGNVNSIAFRFARPAEIAREGGGWRLAPVDVVLDSGTVRLAGRYGNGLEVQARFDGLDLTVLNAFSPDLGFGGRASGSIDYAAPAGGVATGQLRLRVAGFTRTGIVARSTPVDLAAAGTLRADAAAFAAVIRRGGTVIGRAQVRMQPMGGGVSLIDRLMHAPIAGGVRYNGPADVPMSFANLAGHTLTGPIAAGADVSGTFGNPHFVGVLRADDLTYTNAEFGTRITNLAMQARFDGSRLLIQQLSGHAGDGTVTGSGSIGLAAAAGFPIDLNLAFNDATLARGDDLGATVTGALSITNSQADGARISGDLALGEVRYQFVRQGAADVHALSGVRHRGEPIRQANAEEEDEGVPSIWRLDLRVHGDNRIFVSGMGLDSEWSADLRVRGTSATPRIVGGLDLIRGDLSVAGRRFELTRGHVDFDGARPPAPRLDIEATADIEDVTVTVDISGSSANPQIAFSSTPALPQDEVVSRILFGTSVTEISAIQALQVAASLNALRGGGGGLNPLGKLRSATGLARVRILGADDTTGRGTALAAGLYVSNKIYIEVVTDARGFTATQIEISLSRALSLLSQFSQTAGTSGSIRYRRDY